MKKYKSARRGFINYLLLVAIALPIIIFLLDPQTFFERPAILLPLLGILIQILWIYFDTSYKITEDELYYYSGFIKGKIKISNIREITKGKTMWSGLKPALSPNGLTIRYNRFDKIYISPENNDEVITNLLRINPEIQIVKPG
ncbi:hypothetical protein DSL64_19710 [Dyadobacter luteus]|uniref:Uncharacterized protein YyaB-like PH domain-containing protein n=1 Tax=Dyadobacter luteus TaxID=2259619 RepID=A0A3D8Y7F0_9BACT|nr:PH domain-containing protein [Dyadobacter luteus]REA58922.1 hypothetical protein DSL64_19710 [Dyadobacter luteus]